MLLSELASGGSFLGVSATGSGKSRVWLIPAAADACAALLSSARETLAPVDVVVVPTASLGASHEDEGDEFLLAAAKRAVNASRASTGGLHPSPIIRYPRALYVERHQQRERPTEASTEPMTVLQCPQGCTLEVR